MQHPPTLQQQAIIRHFQTSRESLIVTALAGSGKTTTALEAVRLSRDPSTMICAFNKRIQTDMEAKLQDVDVGRRVVAVRTLHSIGFEILRRHWNGVKVNDRDTGLAMVARCFHGSGRHRYLVARLVRYCKDVHPRMFKTEPNRIAQVCRNQIRDPKILDNEVVLQQIAQGVHATLVAAEAERGEIDYADMLWLPIIHDLQPQGRFTRVVVDEAQDLNLGQFELIERLVAPGGSIVTIGDLRQGIYDFRGASGAVIWAKMRARGAAELPLTTSFRCARAIVEEAQRLVPAITCLPTAPAGIVDEIQAIDVARYARAGDFVLSRTNADLVTVAVDTWAQGAEVTVEGSDELLNELLQILTEKLNTRTLEGYLKSLKAWHLEQQAKIEKKESSESSNERLEDWVAILGALGPRVGPAKVEQALRGVFGSAYSRSKHDTELLTPSDTAISFSTVHKAKGLEAHRVFLLQESFMQHRNVPLDKISQEEWNIEYVGITRAKEHLTWVRLPWREPPAEEEEGREESGRSHQGGRGEANEEMEDDEELDGYAPNPTGPLRRILAREVAEEGLPGRSILFYHLSCGHIVAAGQNFMGYDLDATHSPCPDCDKPTVGQPLRTGRYVVDPLEGPIAVGTFTREQARAALRAEQAPEPVPGRFGGYVSRRDPCVPAPLTDDDEDELDEDADDAYGTGSVSQP